MSQWGAAAQGSSRSLIRHSRQTKPRDHRLDSIGLASLLEGFHVGRHTGTLTISCGRSQLELLIQNGQPFILRRINDPLLADVLEVVLDVVFWEGATYTFVANTLPAVFDHPASRGLVRIALPPERLFLLAERRAAAWEPIRQVVGGNTTVLRFANRRARTQAELHLGRTALLAAIDGRRTFQEVVGLSGEPRVKAGLMVTRLLQTGLLTVARMGSQRLPIRNVRAG